MAISYPYTLAALADKMPIASIKFDIQRNDQFSGLGTGQMWQSELAPPLWTADIALGNMTEELGLEIAALIRKLHGAQEAFYLYDLQRPYPKLDPTGSILGSSVVQVNATPSNKNTVALKGLPASYAFSVGDKIQISNSISGKTTFHEVSDAISANGSGVTGSIQVFPRIPAWVAANDTVTLKNAACLMKVMPGSHNPGTSNDISISGASLKAIQRK